MILGLYARRGSLDPSLAEPVLKAFSLGGARELEVVQRDGFHAARATGGASVLPAQTQGERVVLAAGHPFNAEQSLVKPLADAAPAPVEAPPSGASGSFAFAVYDEPSHRLALGNDAFGFQPLFVAVTDDFVAFCSEYEPLLELAGVSRELDMDAVADYYALGLTLADRTLVRGIAMLPSGTVRTFEDGGIKDHRHDPLKIPVNRSLSFEQHAKHVADAFQKAVRSASDSFPDALLSLTGGADTRLVLSSLTAEQRQRHEFATHYGERGTEKVDRDVVIAVRLAERSGVRHEAIFLDGGHEPVEPATFGVHRARVLGQRAIHGVLGGEYLGGCSIDVSLFPARRVSRAAVDERLAKTLSAEARSLMKAHPYDTLQQELKRTEAEDNEHAFWLFAFARPFFTQLYFGTAGVRTSTWMTPWQMHQRVVAPFADPDFLRALLAVPFEYLSGYRLYNEIYKSILTEFNDIPTNSGLAVRSDSALTMFTDGEEPKRVRKDRTADSRRQAIARFTQDDITWSRGLYERSSIEAALQSELESTAKPTMMTRLKNGYTRSPLFKLRHVLPIHGMLMKWKSTREMDAAAGLNAPLVPTFADFETWSRYAEVPGAREAVGAGR